MTPSSARSTTDNNPAPKPSVPLNGADATLRWSIADVWGHFDDDHTRPDAPLLPSEGTVNATDHHTGVRRAVAQRSGYTPWWPR